MENNKPRIELTKGIDLKFDRTGTAAVVHGKCDITGKETFCIEVYGPIKISIQYINEQLQKMPPVQIAKIDLEPDKKKTNRPLKLRKKYPIKRSGRK